MDEKTPTDLRGQDRGDQDRSARREISGRRAGWSLLASGPGRLLLRGVCALMVQRLESDRGAPVIESRSGIVRLWRIERYEEVSLSHDALWVLQDGTRLSRLDPVLELHIRGDRLVQALSAGASWKAIMAEEFRSIVPVLAKREETAIVGSTILRRQVTAFGASLRDAPRGLHTTFDTFYRRLILVAFHPAGLKRVLAEKQGLADAAISRDDFCSRFGADDTRTDNQPFEGSGQ